MRKELGNIKEPTDFEGTVKDNESFINSYRRMFY